LKGAARIFRTLVAVVAIGGVVPSTHESAAVPLVGPAGSSAPSLVIYFIDVEGGQSTLIVTPDRQAMLVDAGFPGNDDRDPKRIMTAIHDAGISRLDYLVLTHFHQDHIGGVPAIAAQIPIGAIVDHDVLFDSDRFTLAAFHAYEPVRSESRLIHPKAGDRLPLKGVELVVASASGQTLSRKLRGGGELNPSCTTFEKQAEDPGENAQSIGISLRYGSFRFLDLGDLNWNKLAQLVCPANLIGRVDVYLVSHHGNLDSNLPQLLAAVQPRVAVINNSPNKGGAPETLAALHRLQGLEGVWQLHRSVRQGSENFADEYVANLDGPDQAYWLKLTARRDGRFSIVNARTGFSGAYPMSHQPGR